MANKKTGKSAEQEIVSVTPNEVNSAALQVVMVEESKKRGLVTEYIKHHMKESVDFGTIKFGGKESKPSLFKPGSEKFLSLFKLTARFEKDTDTWEMAGSEAGVFAYKCLLLSQKGEVVGEGRGVSKLSEKAGWTINNAVKIAEKRAQIDAVLRTGALSDFFTQDLEDMVQQSNSYERSPIADKTIPTVTYDDPEILDYTDGDMRAPMGAHTPPAIPQDPLAQRKRIFALLKGRGVDITNGDACREFVATETQLELSEQNYKHIIEALEK